MKTIVVASGKGGTGKTTATAAFAMRAASRGPVVVADADVEGSNLPIALRVTGESCDAFEGLAVAAIDPPACISCGICEAVCRFDAVVRLSDGRFGIDGLACEGCRACASACPAGAVTMVPTLAGRSCVGSGASGTAAFGELEPAQDLSGKLVTEVRKKATDAARDEAAGLLLVDGPPGVGCPVIAAVTNTDLLVVVTEPSLSGEHDLMRLHELALRFGIPVVAVLNKADLSAEGAERIRAVCLRRSIEIVGEVPYDPELARLLGHLAAGARPELAAALPQGPGDTSAGLAALGDAWERIVARVESHQAARTGAAAEPT